MGQDLCSVDVKHLLFKYSSISAISQGVSGKNHFFGSYAKMLCKPYYVNLVKLGQEQRIRWQKLLDVVAFFANKSPYLFGRENKAFLPPSGHLSN